MTKEEKKNKTKINREDRNNQQNTNNKKMFETGFLATIVLAKKPVYTTENTTCVIEFSQPFHQLTVCSLGKLSH